MNAESRSFVGLVLMLVLAGSACSAGTTVRAQPNPTETTAATAATSATSTSAAPATTTMSATGTVIAVDGNLSAVASFAVRLEDGSTLHLIPARGLLFDDSGPLSHVRDHIVNGSPVLVEFHEEGDLFVATAVGDAE